MANLIANLLGSTAGDLVDKIAGAADRFITTDGERNQYRLETEKVLQARDSEIEQSLRAELTVRERIMVAELQQDDTFTKRARPAVVYVGLAVIVFNYCLAPMIAWTVGKTPPVFNLPEEFWYAWGGILGLYTFGRSMEKRNRRPLPSPLQEPPTPIAAPLRLLGEKP
ncbi:holin family protein [Nevskia sp.]|uniref:holin family protein n=1 Tax=Nevskia sp. TaxID=1929292 RepID=UPI0025FEB63B|nr:holin family protein [Nevskia sp.]